MRPRRINTKGELSPSCRLHPLRPGPRRRPKNLPLLILLDGCPGLMVTKCVKQSPAKGVTTPFLSRSPPKGKEMDKVMGLELARTITNHQTFVVRRTLLAPRRPGSPAPLAGARIQQDTASPRAHLQNRADVISRIRSLDNSNCVPPPSPSRPDLRP